MPLPGFGVVAVEDLVAVAARAVSIHEHEIAGGVVEKSRIGDAALLVTGHAVQRLERVGRERLGEWMTGAEVDERRGMHVGGEVHEAVAIDRHLD